MYRRLPAGFLSSSLLLALLVAYVRRRLRKKTIFVRSFSQMVVKIDQKCEK